MYETLHGFEHKHSHAAQAKRTQVEARQTQHYLMQMMKNHLIEFLPKSYTIFFKLYAVIFQSIAGLHLRNFFPAINISQKKILKNRI